MIINGKEVHFEFNVQAMLNVSKLCPGKSMANLEQFIGDGLSASSIEAQFKVAMILSKAFDDHMKSMDPDHKSADLTMDDFNFMTLPEMKDLLTEMQTVMMVDGQTEVEAEIPKKNGTKTAEE